MQSTITVTSIYVALVSVQPLILIFLNFDLMNVTHGCIHIL